MASEETRQVTISGVEIEVLPQPLMYLGRRAKRLAATVRDVDLNSDMAEIMVGEVGYRGLGALIPDLLKKIPLHAWLGFASEEAMAADELDEDQPPHPPTFPEIRAALAAVTAVNEYDVIQRLLMMLDPQLQEGLLTDLTAAAISILTPSSQLLEAGLEASTSSTQTSPTSTPVDSGSPSPA